ncbi:S8 family serine peptidase, partial [bacterium]|nr:S8 family serine peptidase [bacterium]
QSLSELDGVEAVEVAPERHTAIQKPELDGIPNDPFIAYQWHLDRVAAWTAWDVVNDASDVTIAIVDIGVDLDHPDLVDALWTNTSEANGQNGVDDDGNGFIDDLHGWDFYSDDGDPNATGQDHHGTHCAGIAAATRNNQLGVSGIAPGAKIMALRAGSGNSIQRGFEAMLYAVDNGADIISLSWGGNIFSILEYDVIEYAIAHGVTLIAAAGNSGWQYEYYPAAYESVIAVSATDTEDQLWNASNRGYWVDIAAPGVDIFSTEINSYDYQSGTSMATPLVAGVAALVLSTEPGLSPQAVRARLTQGTNPIPNATTQVMSGRVNAYRSAVSSKPTMVLNSMVVTDNNGDGIVEPGQFFDITLDFDLIGGSASSILVEALSFVLPDESLEGSGAHVWVDQQPGQLITPALPVIARNNTRRGTHPLAISLRVDERRDTLVVNIPIDPPYKTHDASNMEVTVTDFGAFGYFDYLYYTETTPGLRLLDQPVGYLFHGSLMVTDGDNVSDNAYGSDDNDRHDFLTVNGGNIREVEGQHDQQVFEATYYDITNFPDDTGIRILQRSISYPDGLGNFLIIEYHITRIVSGSENYNVGLYADWDIQSINKNQVYFDEGRRLSYTTGEAGAAGMMVLSDEPISGSKAIDNVTELGDGFTDDEKLEIMTGGTSSAQSAIRRDWSSLLAVDIGSLSLDETHTVIFALVAGETANHLLASADAARATFGRYTAENDPYSESIPTSFSLSSAYPNPFNATTQINFALPQRSNVTLTLYDLLGREVQTLVNTTLQAGYHTHSLDANSLVSGVYFIRLETSEFTDTKKIILMR